MLFQQYKYAKTQELLFQSLQLSSKTARLATTLITLVSNVSLFRLWWAIVSSKQQHSQNMYLDYNNLLFLKVLTNRIRV